MFEKHISSFLNENDLKKHLCKIQKTLQHHDGRLKIWVHLTSDLKLKELANLLIDQNIFFDIKVYVHTLIFDECFEQITNHQGDTFYKIAHNDESILYSNDGSSLFQVNF